MLLRESGILLSLSKIPRQNRFTIVQWVGRETARVSLPAISRGEAVLFEALPRLLLFHDWVFVPGGVEWTCAGPGRCAEEAGSTSADVFSSHAA